MDRAETNGVAPEEAAPAGRKQPAGGVAGLATPARTGVLQTKVLDRISFRARTAPAALLLAVVVCFGLLIPWLGFYWDDWPAIWYLHELGPGGFEEVFAADRPLLGRLFMVTTAVLGESAPAWQAFGLVARWACSLALWWVLRLTWPGQVRQATWVALLFTVYPGFLQQSIAVTYSHGWIILGVFLISIGAMLLAVRWRQYFWPLMLFSWGLSALVMFTDEYFFGLELLRPALLWIVWSERTRDVREKAGRITLQWAPYAVVMIAFLAWRMFLTETPRGEVQVFDRLAGDPLGAVAELAGTAIQDVVEVGALAWIQTLNPLHLRGLGLGRLAAYGAIAALCGLLALVYLAGTSGAEASGDEAPGARRRWAVQAILVGLLGLALGGVPFWATSLPVKLKFPWDRFTLAMMLGACLLFVGLIELLVRRRAHKVLVLAAAIGLAAGFHFQNGLTYVEDWGRQREFFWQLTWRAPAVEPGTALLTADMPFLYYTDNSLTGPLNWVLGGEPDRGGQTRPYEMPYLLADLEVRLGNGVEGLEVGAAIEQPYRATAFHGSTDQALVIYMPASGCLRVLDPERDGWLSWRSKDDLVERALPLSNLAVIRAVSGQPEVISGPPETISGPPETISGPPETIFGPEPAPGWCTYYEKAELARQVGDWERVAALGSQALGKGFGPEDDSELLPFVEGYARSGDWEAALSLASQVRSRRSRPALCELLNGLRQDVPPKAGETEALAEVEGSAGCGGR